MTYTISYPENVSVEEQRRAFALGQMRGHYEPTPEQIETFLKGPQVAEADDNTKAVAERNQELLNAKHEGWNDAIDAALVILKDRGFMPASNKRMGAYNNVSGLYKS